MGPPTRGSDPEGLAATRGGGPQSTGEIGGAATPAWARGGPGPGRAASADDGTGSGHPAEGGGPEEEFRWPIGGDGLREPSTGENGKFVNLREFCPVIGQGEIEADGAPGVLGIWVQALGLANPSR